MTPPGKDTESRDLLRARLRYPASLRHKARLLQDGLDRLGNPVERPVILHAPLGRGLRTRCKFKILPDREGRRWRGTDPLQGAVPVEEMLWILPAWAQKLVVRMRELFPPLYREFPVDGIELKLAHGRRRAHLILSVRRSLDRDYAIPSRKLLARLPEVCGVAVPSRRLLVGDESINHLILGREYISHYAAFFQSHPQLTPRLLKEAAAAVKDWDGEGLVDLFCGMGMLGLHLGVPSSRILGIDSDSMAIASAKLNAARLGYSRAGFICGRLATGGRMPDLPPEDLVVIDPPRQGCPDGLISAVAKHRPRLILLVSCSHRTLFRDLGIWRSEGYALRRMSALDMFPFSEFLETVSLLSIAPG